MGERFVVSDRELESVLGLDATQRYAYFVKRVADWEQIWALWEDGWGMVGSGDGVEGIPFWPALEFASVCIAEQWGGFTPRPIPIDEFMGDLAIRMKENGAQAVVFPTPEFKGVFVEADMLVSSLKLECQNYE